MSIHMLIATLIQLVLGGCLLLFLGRLDGLEVIKNLCNGIGAVDHVTQGDNDPESVTEHHVGPVIVLLRTGEVDAQDKLAVPEETVVEQIAVELAHADHHLEWVSPRMVCDDGVHDEKGDGTPQERSDGFHDDQKGVLGQVPRVGKRVFFPQLAE